CANNGVDHVMQLLIQNGANVNSLSKYGTPLSDAIMCRSKNPQKFDRCIALLKRKGADLELAEAIQALRFTGHVWGIAGSSPVAYNNKFYEISFEGAPTVFSMGRLAEYARRYVDRNKENLPLDKKTMDTILSALDHPVVGQSFHPDFPPPEMIQKAKE